MSNKFSQQLCGVIASYLSSLAEVSEQYRCLSDKYRRHQAPTLAAEADIRGYLAGRFTATFASARAVLTQVGQHLQHRNAAIHRIVDIGGGPGTATLAAYQVLGTELRNAIVVDHNPKWQPFIEHVNTSLLRPLAWPELQWQNLNFSTGRGLDSLLELPHTLGIFSYTLNELSDLSPILSHLLPKLLQHNSYVLVIEPGTPAGFAVIAELRQWALANNAEIIAPCTHRHSCPAMDPANNFWCHFRARFDRPEFHQLAKKAFKGFEDEKFSYLLLGPARGAVTVAEEGRGRIVGEPRHHKGHSTFAVCAEAGLQNITLSKKLGLQFKQAKKLSWGDILPSE